MGAVDAVVLEEEDGDVAVDLSGVVTDGVVVVVGADGVVVVAAGGSLGVV